MASGDGEHRAREREWCRRATEGLEGLSGVVRTRRTALDGRSRGTAARVSMPLRIRTVRNIQTPNRRFSSPSLGGRPTRVQNLLTAFAVASRPLSPRAPRTPRGPVSHERQLADRSFSRPFHPTCLRRVDRGARPHRLSRIFQSSSDFLVSSSPFSIPRPPLDARSRVTPASDNQPTTGKRMSTASLAASASLAPRAVPAAGTRRAPRATSRAASRAASLRAAASAAAPPAALKMPPSRRTPRVASAWRSWRTGGSGGTGRATDATTSAPARTTTGPSSSSSTVSARTPTTGATPSPRSPVAGSASTRCACSGTVGRPRWRSRTRWNTGARR